MIYTILFLAVIVLIIKVYQNSRRLHDFDVRFNLLQRDLSILEQKLKDLSGATKPSPVTAEAKPVSPTPAPAKPAPQEKPPAVVTALPSTPPPKIEPSPAPKEKIATPQPPLPKPPVAPPPPPYVPPPPSWKMPKFDWESLVGVKLFSWIAGVALLVAAVAFLRYSKAQGWLTPPVQMAIGVIVGIVLLVLCELKAARKRRHFDGRDNKARAG